MGNDEIKKIFEKLSKTLSRKVLDIGLKLNFVIDKEKNEITEFKKGESLIIPKTLDYSKIGGLSNEVVEKLSTNKPPNLGAASRISGITPAAIIALLRHVKRSKNNKKSI